MNEGNPTLEAYLPELVQYVRDLSERYRNGEVASWDHLVLEIENFFTPQNRAEIEQALPGWAEMTSYADGLTQVHTIGVLIAIMISPAYQRATEKQKDWMEWSGLLHDISKRVVMGQPDLTHAFRSAAQAARVLVQAGFIHQEYTSLESWIDLTKNAVVDVGGREIQDNGKLPEIMAGLEAIFGENQSALVILKAILFHWSFTTVKDWPCAAPLTVGEVKAYLDGELLGVMGPLILADSDSWNLFDPETRERYQSEIAGAIGVIGILLETKSVD